MNYRPRNLTSLGRKPTKVAFFGHFGCGNFGNESSLQAILYHLRRFQPDVEVTSICTGPDATVATHRIDAVPVSDQFLRFFAPQHPLVRRVCIGIPSEPYRWVRGLMKLRRTDMLIIPGTGLLTDADGLRGPGPYNLFKWSLLAKLCRCQLLFVSVGAGPIYGALGKWLVKAALSLADFRSYRDDSSKQYLKSIGFRVDTDRVYPDLAFSLPEAVTPHQSTTARGRPVAGLGLMVYPGKYSVPKPRNEIYLAYLENLVSVVRWLLGHGYDVRLLIGDRGDTRATEDFRRLVRERLSTRADEHIIDEPICSVADLMSQIAATDIVVATRFHNVLLALLCNKPVIAISFHHKCESLMTAMGLSEYCLDINDFRADTLIAKLGDLERTADKLKPLIREKVTEFRKALDEQYQSIFNTGHRYGAHVPVENGRQRGSRIRSSDLLVR